MAGPTKPVMQTTESGCKQPTDFKTRLLWSGSDLAPLHTRQESDPGTSCYLVQITAGWISTKERHLSLCKLKNGPR